MTLPDAPASRRFADVLATELLRDRVREDWTTAAWGKLLLDPKAGGIGPLSRRCNRTFGSDADARDLVLSLILEIAKVVWADDAAIPDEMVERMLESLVCRAGWYLSLIVVDRIEGRPTEWDVCNALVDRFIAWHGVEVPLIRMLTTLIRLGKG